jgi:hypothetical protein
VIYTLRTFLVERANFRRFVELSEGAIWPALEQRDGRSLGLWSVVMGGAERIVLITRYESLAHWQETRGWPEGRQGSPRGAIGGDAVVERAVITRETDLIALEPLSRRMPIDDAPEERPGLYTLRSFRVRGQDHAEFVRLTEEIIWPWFERMGSRHLCLWRTTIAEEPKLYMLSRYDDLAHWEATRGAGPEPADPEQRPGWQAAREALAARAALTQHSGVLLLRPISSRRP